MCGGGEVKRAKCEIIAELFIMKKQKRKCGRTILKYMTMVKRTCTKVVKV